MRRGCPVLLPARKGLGYDVPVPSIDDDALVLDWTGNDGAVLARAVSTMAAHITDLVGALGTPERGGAAEGIGDLDDSTMRKLAAALGTARDTS